MNCSQCGNVLQAGARFCGSCGAPVAAAAPGSRPSEFHVVGDVMQAVVIPLQPGHEIQAEPGALLYMAGDVEMDSNMKGGWLGGLKRMVAGESLFMTRFRSRGGGQVAFAAPHPGKLKQIDLDPGRNWLCQRDSFLCATEGVDINIAFTKRLGAGFFGGEGFILQRLSGDGTVFIHGGGNFVEFDLEPGQVLHVDTGCIVAFEERVQYDIRFVGGFKNALFGGEGLFLATLQGPGKTTLQTLPFSRLAGRIMGTTREGTGGVAGVGGTLRDLGNIFGGGE
ncbi:MAG TPA: TIGR00266 family protein [Vicinamibacteria bacterium]|nr:TIGR00266 family protein [Vicinamibacteria bacterium]